MKPDRNLTSTGKKINPVKNSTINANKKHLEMVINEQSMIAEEEITTAVDAQITVAAKQQPKTVSEDVKPIVNPEVSINYYLKDGTKV